MHRPHVLFVCSRNQWRSPTAEAVYRNDPRIAVRSAGLSAASRRVLRERDLDWADLVLVMERKHLTRIRGDFPGHAALARMHSLEIPDDFELMDSELVRLIVAGTEPHLHRLQEQLAAETPPS
jgi:predicted protein tyrosine phosphatase